MNILKNFIYGIFIGIGSIAPGVSGGALAMIFGIYDKIIKSVSSFFKNIKENFYFLANVGIGCAIGIVAFSNILKFLFETFNVETMLAFAGFILGTLPSLFKRANIHGYKHNYLIPFFITLTVAVIFSLFPLSADTKTVTLNFPTAVYLVIIGFVMAGSLVIPGISGTVLLMLIGAYGLVINTVADIKNLLKISPRSFNLSHYLEQNINNIIILIFLGTGLVIGVFVFSLLMNKLLKINYSMTYYAIIGFVVGSVVELFPKVSFNTELLAGVILFLISMLASLYINNLVKNE